MLRLLLVLAATTAISDGYKIVIFSPDVSNSQVLWNKRVAEELARAGHEVTILSLAMWENVHHPKVDIDPLVKVLDVNVTTGVDGSALHTNMGELLFEDIPIWDARHRKMMTTMSSLPESCKTMVQNDTLLQQLKDAKFDIAFAHMLTFCPIGLIHAAGIPSWVWLNSAALMDNVAHLMGVPLPPSYCTPLMMDASDTMSFFERFKSFAGHLIFRTMWKRMIADPETRHFRDKFGEDFPDLIDLAAKAPVVMVNTNELYDFARPTLHKIVNIGGVGIKSKDAKLLPKEYSRLAETADGHIVFSFGSFAPAYLMPDRWKKAFFDSFKQFPKIQFFMRYEKPEDIMNVLPKNVFAAKWLPQTDLLQHHKALGLITHCGYNSFQDAVHSGTPVICIPLLGDQQRNSHLATKLGFGINIKKAEVYEENVCNAIRSLITDRTLKESVMRLRAMIAKKPVTAEQLLLKWTEFVAEFKELDNLVPAGAQFGLIKYHSLDVIGALAAGLLASLVIFCLFIRCLFRRCWFRVRSPVEKRRKRE